MLKSMKTRIINVVKLQIKWNTAAEWELGVNFASLFDEETSIRLRIILGFQTDFKRNVEIEKWKYWHNGELIHFKNKKRKSFKE